MYVNAYIVRGNHGEMLIKEPNAVVNSAEKLRDICNQPSCHEYLPMLKGKMNHGSEIGGV